jgi:L-fuculose-phosphate aldolase
MTEKAARTALVAAGKRLLAEGLVARTWGNLSVRLDDRSMAVTPSGIPYTDLREDQIVIVDLETGEWAGNWKPSGERKVHREIYRSRPGVKAVVHTHQNAASACAAARVPVPMPWGEVKCAAYALPGTKKLTQVTVDALGDRPGVLMANHGVFTVGADLDEAFDRVSLLEKACADFLESRAPEPLPCRADAAWDPAWVTPQSLDDGTKALVSAAPFTLAWSLGNVPLGAVLDDLAQLAGRRVDVSAELPRGRPKNDVVLVKGRGVVASGPDAEALVLVVEKAARAALGAQGLGGAKAFPGWEASLMRFVYRQSYSKQAARAR